MACCAAATRSGFCKCGTPGNFRASSRASSFAAPARWSAADDGHWNIPLAAQWASHSTSGVLPVPPKVRFPR